MVLCLGALAPARTSAQATHFASLPVAAAPAVRRDTADQLVRRPSAFESADVIRRAYESRGGAPFWLEDGGPSVPARALLDAIARAASRGLDPEDYDYTQLHALARRSAASAEARAEFESALSTSAVQLLHDLRSGRVAPGEAHGDLRLSSDSADLAPLLEALAESVTPDSMLDAQEPPYAAYRNLKLALARYRDLAVTDTTLRPRVERIALAMERWRWMPRSFSVAPVIVNIAAFQLQAWTNTHDEGGALTMNVIVGDALRHQTPVFADSIQYMVFAPYWIVPANIAKAELVPIGLRDAHTLAVNNYEIVSQRGKVLPFTRASVLAVQRDRAFIRQLPGGSNSLGRVKFMFPNTFDVYLHDTPVVSEFARTRRDVSHGCIRVADPVALAMHLLQGAAGWDSTRVTKAMNGFEPIRVDLPRAVPIYLLYATAEARADGSVTFHDDVYGHDTQLASLMARTRGVSGVEAAHNQGER